MPEGTSRKKLFFDLYDLVSEIISLVYRFEKYTFTLFVVFPINVKIFTVIVRDR